MTTINVMAPLLVGDPRGRDTEETRRAWLEFATQLAAVKAEGVAAVSTDVWWGLVEKSERRYHWEYYDRLSDCIIAAGLKWVPIMSTHQCGGNVGDDVNVMLPPYIWKKMAGKMRSKNVDAACFVSEQGNVCRESISCWATDFVLGDMKAFFAAFMARFAHKAEYISEINISLGPAGELRYPSYNLHDKNAGFPTRGALQCYSELAQQSFADAMLRKYGSVKATHNAWGSRKLLAPPRNVRAFFDRKLHTDTEYGRDLFDWYSESLIEHGRKIMLAALEVFSGKGAAFVGIDLGAKVPGIHWRIGRFRRNKIVYGDRLAELSAGLVSARGLIANDDAHGYEEIVRFFHDLQKVKPSTRVWLHFTCLEMENGQDGNRESLALELVRWVGQTAKRLRVPVKGENALSHLLYDADTWLRLRAALGLGDGQGHYEGLTILRMSDVVKNKVAAAELHKTMQLIASSAE